MLCDLKCGYPFLTRPTERPNTSTDISASHTEELLKFINESGLLNIKAPHVVEIRSETVCICLSSEW